MLYLQLDVDLTRQPRWLRLSLHARSYYMSMLGHGVEHGTGRLSRAEWEDTRVMRSMLGCEDGDAATIIKELAHPASHMIECTRHHIVLVGFDARYGAMMERSARTAERQREWRARAATSARRNAHVTVTDLSRDAHVQGLDVDVDVDVDGKVRQETPPPTPPARAGRGGPSRPREGKAKAAATPTSAAPATPTSGAEAKAGPPATPTSGDGWVWPEMRVLEALTRPWNGTQDHRTAIARRSVMARLNEQGPQIIAHAIEVCEADGVRSPWCLLWSRVKDGKDPTGKALDRAKGMLRPAGDGGGPTRLDVGGGT